MCPMAFGDQITGWSTPDEQVGGSNIPAYTNTNEEGNGRPQHLDTDDRTAQDLNPVERRIITRDTIISNRQNAQDNAGQ